MRSDLETRIVTALDNPDGAVAMARVSLARARHFTREFTEGQAVDFADATGIQAAPLPQDGKVMGGLFWTVMSHAGYLWLANSFQAPMQITNSGNPIASDPYCRPGLCARNDGSLVIYYTEDTAVYQVEVDANTFLGGTAECAGARTLVQDWGKYNSIHALTPDLLMLLSVDTGGVRVTKLEYTYGSGWGRDHWQGRFMFPGYNYEDDDSGARASLNYSAAAQIDNRVIVYLTTPAGSVAGVELDLGNGAWSDSFEVIPADLSRFAVANACMHQDSVYLAGQFQRVDEEGLFVSPYVYGLLLQSGNGRVFSMDRMTAFTGGDADDAGTAARRWMAGIAQTPNAGYGIDGAAVIYSDANRWMALAAHFGIDGTVGDLTIEPILAARGDLNGSISVDLPAEDARYVGLIEAGDVMDLEVGVLTSENVNEWFRLMRCMVTGTSESYADGDLRLTVQAQPLTRARIGEMTHPFTLTLRGRETLRDDLIDFENFERAAEEGYVLFPLAVDFWDDSENVKDQEHDVYEVTEVTSGDLKSTLDLVAYPTIDALPFDIKLYGWSRSGLKNDLTGGGGDVPSNLAAPNDRVYCRLYVSRAGGEAMAVDIDNVQTGSENHFPQTWYATAEGSYPVVVEAQESDGLQVGDEIVKVAMMFANDRTPDTAETVFFPERIEAPDIVMKVDSFDETWAPVEPVEADTIVVVMTSAGIFYTENFDQETPTWVDFNDGLGAEKTAMDSVTYDAIRRKYYACGPSGIWKADGRGQTWVLTDFTAATAVEKINTAGFTCNNNAIPTDGSNYWSIYCSPTGVVYCYGGANKTGHQTNCNDFRMLFRSDNGLETLDPISKLIHGTTNHVAITPGQIRELSSGRIVETFECGWGVGWDANGNYSDDKGATQNNFDGDAFDEISSIMEAQSDRLLGYCRTGDLIVIDGTTRELREDVFPASLTGYTPVTYQAIANNQGTLMASCGDGTYLSDDNGETWTKTDGTALMEDPMCVQPSAIFGGTWLLGGGYSALKPYMVAYSTDNGVNWLDKTGNLDSLAGGDVWFFVQVSSGPPSDEDGGDPGQELLRVGIPVIYFAQKPYYTINCEAAAKYYLNGPNAWGGVCCLASDGENYIAARAAIDRVQLIKVRSGMATVLAETETTFPPKYGWILLRHVDGLFEVRTKDTETQVWSDPLIEYEWQETDGIMALDPLISHVGIYALLDAPYVRICGFDPEISNRTGILPGAHLWGEFASTGRVRIEDNVYDYTNTHSRPEGEELLGPYQGRNVGGPYGYSNDGANYSGNAAEFTRLDWIDNSAHHSDFDGEYMATDGGIVWAISDVDFQPYITTEGVQVFLKNRGRYFSGEANGDVIGMSVPVWITHVLMGLRQVSGEAATHGKGSIAYLINESTVRIYEFAAASGYDDLTDRDAIERVCRTANGEANFPGDATVDAQTLSSTPWRVV